MSEWQPIETSPKDGTLIDLWSARYNARLPDCKFEQNEWDNEPGHWYQAYSENPSSFHYVSPDDDLTHWMPRPAPPGTYMRYKLQDGQWISWQEVRPATTDAG